MKNSHLQQFFSVLSLGVLLSCGGTQQPSEENTLLASQELEIIRLSQYCAGVCNLSFAACSKASSHISIAGVIINDEEVECELRLYQCRRTCQPQIAPTSPQETGERSLSDGDFIGFLIEPIADAVFEELVKIAGDILEPLAEEIAAPIIEEIKEIVDEGFKSLGDHICETTKVCIS